jgi:tRNA pseudouridine55 synthase
VRTASGDSEGEVIERREVPAITPQRLAEVQAQFTGPIVQVPPMHSALKKDGKALYEYARAGIEVEREPRPVTIFDLQLSLLAPDQVKILAKVSKGTYIRTLGEDIGLALGCGAHLRSLRRIATGPFDVAQCITLQELEALPESDRWARLLPVEALLAGHTRVTLGPEDSGRFLSGMRRRGGWRDTERAAVFGEAPSTLLGTAHVKAGELIPSRLLSPIEIQQILGVAEPQNV